MNRLTYPLLLAWLSFIGFSAWASIASGPFSFWSVPFQNPESAQVSLDLFISFVLIAVWIVHDGRRRGITAWPFAIGTLVLGNLVSLGYLTLRCWRDQPSVDTPGR